MFLPARLVAVKKNHSPLVKLFFLFYNGRAVSYGGLFGCAGSGDTLKRR
ncbi:hypothetical protein HMPREF1548_04906 [Clostridium sp. KLE 1755]|nr:hypothetical protein HMPREF1548_04906 [Clostridium sp. KLE 1755]